MIKFIFLSISIAFCIKPLAQSPPTQPISGPGGNIYSNSSVIFSDHTNLFSANGYWLFEPGAPKPDSADVIIFNHGYGVFNPGPYAKWIEHLVKKGNIVIFPKYQLSDASLPSSYTINAVTGIQNALIELNSNVNRVKPRLNHFGIIGHSYGGVITANLVTNYSIYNIPKPQCFMLCQPGTGGINSGRINSYTNMDNDYKVLIVVGEDDIVVGDSFGREIMDSTNIPTSRKNFITHVHDYYGFPILEATHNEPLATDFSYDGGTLSTIITGAYSTSKTDAIDFYCYWKLADALLNCTFYGDDCEYAFGDTPEQKNMGQWSDGTSINKLIIEPFTSSSVKDNSSSFHIYPNPTNNLITIEGSQSIKSIRVTNNLGQIILNKFTDFSEEISLINQPLGSYYLTIVTDNNSNTYLIVKN